MQQISEAIGFLAMTLIQLTHSFNTVPLRYPNVQTTLPEIEKNTVPLKNSASNGEEQSPFRERKSLP